MHRCVHDCRVRCEGSFPPLPPQTTPLLLAVLPSPLTKVRTHNSSMVADICMVVGNARNTTGRRVERKGCVPNEGREKGIREDE